MVCMVHGADHCYADFEIVSSLNFPVMIGVYIVMGIER